MAENPNVITLTRFLLSEEHTPLPNRVEMANLFSGIQLACKITANAIRRAGIEHLFGMAGATNVHNEEVKKLDVISNDAFIFALKSTKEVCALVSEEETNAIFLEEGIAGKYVICFDPLDGSSNIDANVSIGSIFAIWTKVSAGKTADMSDVLRTGRDMIASGYALYGSSTMLVISLGHGVYGFTLDQSVGEFVLTHPNIRVKPKGSIYSVNEGNSSFWEKPTADYVAHVKSHQGRAPYSLRYVGSMVADVHRTLLYGGIFMYPADSKAPTGKLRYLYEVAPLSYIMEQAGGRASTGRISCLDIVPANIHLRVPVYMGSADDVTEVESFFARAAQQS